MDAQEVRRGVVLLVIGDANTMNAMREYLTRARFEVRSAANGWEALKRIRSGDIDLIVADASTDEVDGASLRDRCMVDPDARDTPFVFLVKGGDADAQVRALRSGVDDCIVKPIDPIVLVTRVQAVLERRLAYAQMVRIDPLTRMLNRHTVMAEMRNELVRARRYARQGTLMLIDLDHFTEVNKEAGVPMGDLMLTCMAGVILSSLRGSDLAGRIRGEQFLLCLPETPIDGAAILARRLQERLRAISDNVAAMPLTFSAGIAAIPDHGDGFDDLLDKASAALSAAKAEGKGIITTWSAGLTA